MSHRARLSEQMESSLGYPKTSANEAYIYKPLPNDNQHPYVRMFELAPSSRHTGPLRGQMTECLLQSEVFRSSEALSYTWGDLPATHPLKIESKMFTIGKNLYDSLQRLRLPDKERRVWVDAICINQADNAERSNQVNLMGQIYATGSRVVA